jgi:hypothetical protein
MRCRDHHASACPVRRQKLAKSFDGASACNPSADNATAIGQPDVEAANCRFSVTVNPGFTASWCPT